MDYERLWNALKEHKQKLVSNFEKHGDGDKAACVAHKTLLDVMEFLELKEQKGELK
jgi:hypothetical protein